MNRKGIREVEVADQKSTKTGNPDVIEKNGS